MLKSILLSGLFFSISVSSAFALDEVLLPKPFQLQNGALPEKYAAANVYGLYKILEANGALKDKGEYETTTEYETRISNVEDALKPLDTNAEYAFKIRANYKYDADKGAFIFSDSVGPCDSPKRYSSDDVWFVCGSDSFFKNVENYYGTNSYGTTVLIKKEEEKILGVAFRRSSIQKINLFKKDILGGYYINTVIPFDRNKARDMPDFNVSVLLVGRFEKGILIEGEKFVVRPKASDPRDIEREKWGIPFKISKIIFYIHETGEVISIHEYNKFL